MLKVDAPRVIQCIEPTFKWWPRRLIVQRANVFVPAANSVQAIILVVRMPDKVRSPKFMLSNRNARR